MCQFVFLPLAGFASIRLFYRGDPVHGIPLLVTVCSPGGSYSNWWCSLFNSDLPLSMAMTSASSLFAVATLPINVLIYLKLSYPSEESAVTLDWGGLFTSLAVVVAGIVSGLILGRNKPAWRPRLNAVGNAAGVALVLLGLGARGSLLRRRRHAVSLRLSNQPGVRDCVRLAEAATPFGDDRDVLPEHRHCPRRHTEQLLRRRR